MRNRPGLLLWWMPVTAAFVLHECIISDTGIISRTIHRLFILFVHGRMFRVRNMPEVPACKRTVRALHRCSLSDHIT